MQRCNTSGLARRTGASQFAQSALALLSLTAAKFATSKSRITTSARYHTAQLTVSSRGIQPSSISALLLLKSQQHTPKDV